MNLNVRKGHDSAQKQMHFIRVSGAHYAQINEIKHWVDSTFGESTPGLWNPRWSYSGNGLWHFRNEADAIFFMLRWE
jgi:hypothetical protein